MVHVVDVVRSLVLSWGNMGTYQTSLMVKFISPQQSSECQHQEGLPGGTPVPEVTHEAVGKCKVLLPI